ncbi:MAG TPA: ABC transporter permease [Trebonia sp.]|jgi:putative ABC transport system permease protein|nr:ABC transporter permease [Trebonia sp.]
MSAVFRAARGGLGGRKLQAIIIGLVVLVATAASTLALGMLADAHSPFDHAFASQNGADVAVTVDTSVASAADITAATKVAGVTAAAGPFAAENVNAQISIPGIDGTVNNPMNLVGRSSPGGPVDDLTLQQGHWVTSDNQIVISSNAPGQLGSTIAVNKHVMTVVGIANSVTNTADAWVLPAEMNAIAGSAGSATSGGRPPAPPDETGQAQLLYRFSSSGSSTDITNDINEIKAALPSGAVLGGPVSYLDIRESEQSNVAPWVPFIIAFGVIALVISVLIVVNVVGGAVVAGTTRIGVLKSIGFTPLQVVACYVLLVAVPAVTGAVVGAVCGNLLAAPLYRQNAQVYQVGVLGVPFWVDLAVPLAVLALTIAAAVAPASRAGAMSPVQAIATGRAPRPRHGFFAQRLLARLTRVPRPVTLGFASPAARPGRTLVTVVAVLFGAAAVTFGVGLSISLNRVYNDISNGARLPVQVNAPPPGALGRPGPVSVGPGKGPKPRRIHIVINGPGPGALTAAQQHAITTAITATPGALHYLSESDDNLSLPGLGDVDGGAQVTAYGDGDPSWSNLVLISGGWYSQSASTPEIDVNTLFLTDTNTAVGGTYTLVNGTHKVTAKIIGQVFAPGNDVSIYMSPATLTAIDPTVAGPGSYDISLKPGVNADAYASALQAAIGNNYGVNADSGGGKALLAVVTLVVLLTLLIIAVAGLGVLNTVALQIRERSHDIGIFKALGMTPRQTLTMVICSVGITGLVAGIVAVPAGILLHHNVLPAMAHAANSGLPASVISVYSVPEIVILALAGLVIAIAGALLPASWAANSRTATALRTE